MILHIDMDCFFCSVAVRGRPELAGMPVAVCWSNADSDKATHGAISSANYEARKYGIRAGMYIGKAKELCPTLISLPYEFEKYSTTAEALYREVLALTPFVQSVSVDEAFAVYVLSHIHTKEHHTISCRVKLFSTQASSIRSLKLLEYAQDVTHIVAAMHASADVTERIRAVAEGLRSAVRDRQLSGTKVLQN